MPPIGNRVLIPNLRAVCFVGEPLRRLPSRREITPAEDLGEGPVARPPPGLRPFVAHNGSVRWMFPTAATDKA